LHQKRFPHRPVGTTLRKGGKTKRLRVSLKHQHQLFLKDRDKFQVVRRRRSLRQTHQRAIELGVQDLLSKLPGWLGLKGQFDLRALSMKAGKQLRQAACGGGVHRPHAQITARRRRVQRLSGLLGQAEDSQRVAQKMLAGGGQKHPFIAASKQLNAQLLFQLVNAGGDIGLRPSQQFCRASHAALFRHRFKNL